jgi:hypothetical protein
MKRRLDLKFSTPREPANFLHRVRYGTFRASSVERRRVDGKQILKPETLKAMFTPQFRANDQLPPICMGFYETWRNDLRWIGHGGDLIAFHSFFAIEPAQKLVAFVSFNSAASSGKSRPELLNMFADRYFPSDKRATYITVPTSELKAIEGRYQPTRRSESTKLKFDGLMSQRSASLNKDGVLQIEDVKDLRGHTVNWKPIGKDLFQEVDGQRRLFAIRNGQGTVIRLAFDFPGAQFERVPWWENSRFISMAIGGSCGAAGRGAGHVLPISPATGIPQTSSLRPARHGLVAVRHQTGFLDLVCAGLDDGDRVCVVRRRFGSANS